jgi:hypothetical protein
VDALRQELKKIRREANSAKRQAAPTPKSPVEIVGDADNVLRPGLDFLNDLAVVTVAVETRQDSVVRWTPLAVTTDREMVLVESNVVKLGGREFVFASHPLAMASLARWRYQDIQRFCSGESVDAAKLFERILLVHSRYLDYPQDGIAEMLTLWTVGTYFYPLFPAYPYVELNAPRGSGKSKQLSLTAKLAFNGRIIGAPSEASTFRLIQDTRGTICFDEAETFDKDQKAALLQILNMGYAAGGTVARCEERTHAVREFHIYCPKMFASIRGIDSTTATRCIRVQFLRTTDKERGDRSITEDGEPWAEIRHGLYSLALTEFQAIRKIYQSEDVRPFANRENEKWSPLLTLAYFFEQHGVNGLVDSITAFAKEAVEQCNESGLPAFDEAVLRQVWQVARLTSGIVEIKPASILEKIVEDSPDMAANSRGQSRTAQSVGYVLRRLGFKRSPSRWRGSTYNATAKQVQDVARRYGFALESEDNHSGEKAARPASETGNQAALAGFSEAHNGDHTP